MPTVQLQSSLLDTTIDNCRLSISCLYRPGTGKPVLFLHGFGSTKEDYADIDQHPEFRDRPVIAYDAPGCGNTVCADLTKISIPFLVRTALAVLEHFETDHFHIIGHSMGGLTALILADQMPERILSFTDIEGNVAPEDCFLSRQIENFPSESPEVFFDAFIERTRRSPYFSSALYAASLKHKVRAAAVPSIFRSMVHLSDHANLMTKFLALPSPKMFMYGDQNADLSYLPDLQKNGVQLAQIPDCGHFPMYSNPAVMWQRIAAFLDQVDRSAPIPS